MRKTGPTILLALIAWGASIPSPAQARDYARLVVFADLHLPGRLLPEKNNVVATVNGWEDVDGVVALGDLAQGRGTPEEFAFAKEFLSRVKAPVYAVAGNHDYIYDAGPDGKTRKGSPTSRQAKLEAFQETFSLPDLRYQKRFGRYLCLFISIDDLDSPLLASMSSATVSWLEEELGRHPDDPTIIFFHSPLRGALQGAGEFSGFEDFMAQPADRVVEILKANPQVLLWVSGHTHTAPTNGRFRHKADAQTAGVTNIHNCDMDGRSYLSSADANYTKHDTIWTNSLFLHPDKVVVKTYDHKKGAWLKGLTREFRPNPRRQEP